MDECPEFGSQQLKVWIGIHSVRRFELEACGIKPALRDDRLQFVLWICLANSKGRYRKIVLVMFAVIEKEVAHLSHTPWVSGASLSRPNNMAALSRRFIHLPMIFGDFSLFPVLVCSEAICCVHLKHGDRLGDTVSPSLSPCQTMSERCQEGA